MRRGTPMWRASCRIGEELYNIQLVGSGEGKGTNAQLRVAIVGR